MTQRGRPVTSRMDESIQKINEILRKYRHLSIRTISDKHENLQIMKIGAKMLSKTSDVRIRNTGKIFALAS